MYPSGESERIGIVQDGELCPEGLEDGHVQIRDKDLFHAGYAGGQSSPIRVYDGRTSAVLARRILPYPVDTKDVTLVLDGPCTEQRIPGVLPHAWPAGDVYGGVIVLAVRWL